MGSKIGIVTVTYNSGTVIDGFMKSVISETYQEFMVYIVDNASSDDTLQKMREYQNHLGPRVVIIANKENIGVAAGNNQGIKKALEDGCDYVLLINNDVEFEEQLFQKLLAGLERYQCDIVIPKIYYYDNPQKIWCAGGHFQWWQGYQSRHYGEGEIDKGQYDEAKKVSYSPTCCMLIKAEVFDNIGIMDEKYFVYYDDTDFCFRASKSNVSMYYLPSATLLHKVSSLTGGGTSLFTIRYTTRNRTYFMKKNIRAPFSLMWLLVYQLVIWGYFLTRKNSWSVYKLKQKALLEGLVL
ncbi:glycosyltransferase family 2 protein [Anaerospora hongkongensis]|uniref:glycosyltransferase family 2 protein n=1 Tax=Anaerospora hongkongensis TaxID=244830 RepID=UPI0028A1B037|nr:glycosyltransferase family 2 protein [Anaerospora hongkongensis]